MRIFRFIGMALLAIALSVNFVACSDDDKNELIENENENEDVNEEENGFIMTINVEQAGTLKDLMTEEEQSQVTDLTLSGYLNSTDFKFIRGMTNLAKADFTEAHIIGGGDSFYISGFQVSTSDNIFLSYSFCNFAFLQEIKLPNSVTEIGGYAFRGCTSLTTIEIPNSVTTIGNSAFRDCTSLTTIEIPNSVTTIGMYAFRGCTSLTTIEIPNSVTTIGNSAFRDCTSLTTIEIPNSVTTIGGSAFRDCTSLATIEIPNSVTTIEGYAFDGCTLKEIHVKRATPPSVGNSVFSTYAYTTLYVPIGSKDAYMASNTWGKFGNIIEE